MSYGWSCLWREGWNLKWLFGSCLGFLWLSLMCCKSLMVWLRPRELKTHVVPKWASTCLSMIRFHRLKAVTKILGIQNFIFVFHYCHKGNLKVWTTCFVINIFGYNIYILWFCISLCWSYCDMYDNWWAAVVVGNIWEITFKMLIINLDIKLKYFPTETHKQRLCSKTLNACLSAKCNFGYSYFRSQFSYSQKSKDQKVVHREVLGEGPEERERRRKGGRAEGGKWETSLFGFLINSVWPSLSVFLKPAHWPLSAQALYMQLVTVVCEYTP